MHFGNKLLFLALLLAAGPGCISVAVHKEGNDRPEPGGYDPSLARRLKADEYGMRRYIMAFLKPGPNRNQDSATAAQIQRAHLRNIQRLADEGKLVLAGPFLDDGGEMAGIFLFDVETREEARALTETDPAVQAGRLILELHPWYGSAALMDVPRLHKQLQHKNFSE